MLDAEWNVHPIKWSDQCASVLRYPVQWRPYLSDQISKLESSEGGDAVGVHKRARLTAKGANLGAFSPLECLVNEYGCHIRASASLSAARQSWGRGMSVNRIWNLASPAALVARQSTERHCLCQPARALPYPTGVSGGRFAALRLLYLLCFTFSSLFSLRS